MFRRLLTLGSLVAGCLLTACGSDSPSSDDGGASGSRVAPETEDAAVVSISSPGGSCSAVLVAPNLLLSTAHCVSTVMSWEDFICTADGELQNSGSGAGEIGEPFPPEQINVLAEPLTESGGGEALALGRQILLTGTTAICRNDLAFVVLDRSLLGRPFASLRLNSGVRRGETVTVIGYGSQASGAITGLRRREGLSVSDVGNPPRTFVVDRGLCRGDSGGPALSPETSSVVGVLSMLHGACDSALAGSVFTELSPFRALALQAFQAAGADWWLEGEVSPSPVPGPDAAAAQSVAGCSLARSRAASSSLAQALTFLALTGLVVIRRLRGALNSARQTS